MPSFRRKKYKRFIIDFAAQAGNETEKIGLSGIPLSPLLLLSFP